MSDHPTSAPRIGDNSDDGFLPVEKIVGDLEKENADALARTTALLEKGKEFLVITTDQEDADATEFMVKLRARWKQSEADRISAKTPWDDRAGAIHAFFKTRILDPLGLAPPKEQSTFDPKERDDLGLGPRINMAQTIFKRKKADDERKAREIEAERLRKVEADAKAKRDADEAAARAVEDQRRRDAAAAEKKARDEAQALADAAARKRNVENRAVADAAAAAAKKIADDAADAARAEEENAAAARATRTAENLAAENKIAEETAAAEAAANASLADLSRQRGGRGGVSSLRAYINVRGIDRAALDYAAIGPYFTDKAVRAALGDYADANKATVKAGIVSGVQPIKGAIFFEDAKNAGRA